MKAIATFGTRFPQRFVLPQTSLLVASIPGNQPETRRSEEGLIRVVSCTYIWRDGFRTSRGTLVTASNEVVVAEKRDDE